MASPLSIIGSVLGVILDFLQLGEERKRLYDTTPVWESVHLKSGYSFKETYAAVIDIPISEDNTQQSRYALHATGYVHVNKGLASLPPPAEHVFRIYVVENVSADDLAHHVKERYRTSIPMHTQRGATALSMQWRKGARRRNWGIEAYRLGAARLEPGGYIDHIFLKANTIRQRLDFCILTSPWESQNEAFSENEWLDLKQELSGEVLKYKNHGNMADDPLVSDGTKDRLETKHTPTDSSSNEKAAVEEVVAENSAMLTPGHDVKEEQCKYLVAIITVDSFRQQSGDTKQTGLSASIETQDWGLQVEECHDRLCSMLLGNAGDARTASEIYPQLQVASMTVKKQVLTLWYLRALLHDYEASVAFLSNQYASRKDALTDPRRGGLTERMLDEITKDVCFYEEVKESIADLSAAVALASTYLKGRLPHNAASEDLHEQLFELEASTEEIKRTLETLTGQIENRLRLFELSRGLHEASNVRLLGILASIFLPLSLACAILSMSTRLADLHFVLYDFFGVLFIIGTVVIGILIVLKLLEWTRELGAKLNRVGIYHRKIGPFISWTFRLALVYSWSLCLSSFMVGMVMDVGLGLRILGYGFAALGCLFVLFVLLAINFPIIAVLVLKCIDVINVARSNRRNRGSSVTPSVRLEQGE